MMNESLSENINFSFELPSFISNVKQDLSIDITTKSTSVNNSNKQINFQTNFPLVQNQMLLQQTHSQITKDSVIMPNVVAFSYYPPLYINQSQYNTFYLQNLTLPQTYLTSNSNSIKEIVHKLSLLNSIEDIRYFLSKKQILSFFMNQIDHLSSIEIRIIFNKLYPLIETLMKDPELNIIIQRLIINLELNQRQLFLMKISKNLVSLSCTFYSTYCIQAFIESSISENEQLTFYNFIEKGLFNLATNKQGIHVLTYIFSNFKRKSPLKYFIIHSMLHIAQTKFGVKFLKNIAELIRNKNSSFKKHFTKELETNIIYYATNEYSHYLILHLLEIWNPEDSQVIVLSLLSIKDELTNKYLKRITDYINNNNKDNEFR